MNYLKLHNLHPYHAKFYPGIPQYFLQKYATATSLVLDPFCGSGTTLLECNAQGIHSIGVDINFLSAKISRAKTSIYDRHRIEKSITNILNAIDNTPIEFKDSDVWFTKDNYADLCIFFNAIRKIEEETYRNLFEVVLSSLLNKVCNKRNTWNLGYLSDNILPDKETKISLRTEFEKNVLGYYRRLGKLRIGKIGLLYIVTMQVQYNLTRKQILSLHHRLILLLLILLGITDYPIICLMKI